MSLAQQRVSDLRTAHLSQALSDNFSLQRAVFLVVSDHFAFERNDPPTVASPLRRDKGGVQSSIAAPALLFGSPVHVANAKKQTAKSAAQ